jgi:hypothetical protein
MASSILYTNAIDSADIVMLLLQLSRDSNNSIVLGLMIEILGFADVLPKRRRMFLSTIQNKHRYNENEIFCSYNICSKVKLFIPTTITITIESKDQGWSSYPHEHGQRTSCTWGELSLNKLPT